MNRRRQPQTPFLFLRGSPVMFYASTRYYTFDEAFVREVLGKKLSKGTKKDLDDISTKTGITLKSCRRQVGPPHPTSLPAHPLILLLTHLAPLPVCDCGCSFFICNLPPPPIWPEPPFIGPVLTKVFLCLQVFIDCHWS